MNKPLEFIGLLIVGALGVAALLCGLFYLLIYVVWLLFPSARC